MYRTKNIWIVLIAIFGGILVYLRTRFGVGVSPDSTFYISGAENFLLTGEIRDIWQGAYLNYMNHYPPGYSIMIGVFGLLKSDLYEATRLLNVVLFAGLTTLLGFRLREYLSTFGLIFLLLFVTTSIAFLDISEMAWSENLFLPLSFLGLFYFHDYLVKQQTKYLVLSATIIAFAIFTRYMGIVLPMVVSFILIFHQKGKTKQKVKELLLFNIIASSLFVLWLIRNMLLTNDSASRNLSFHPMDLEYYRDFLLTVKSIFLQIRIPDPLSMVIGGAIFLVIFSVFIRNIFKRGQILASIQSIFVLYFIFTLLFLFISNTFLDFTPLYYRIIAPSLLGVFIAFVLYIDKTLPAKWSISLFVLLLGLHSPKTLVDIYKKSDGKDFAHSDYKVEATITLLQNMDFKKNLIFTNEVDRMYYLVHKVAYWVKDLPQLEASEKDQFVILYKNGRRVPQTLEFLEKHNHVIVLESEDAFIYKLTKTTN